MNKIKTIEITFLTGNKDKIQSAKEVFKHYPIILLNQKIEIPEIQSLDVEEVARSSVKYAVNILKKNIIKVDCGYYFEAFNGFPGALVKYFEKSFSSEDILKLLEGKSRNVVVRECLAYASPEGEIKTFLSETKATIAYKPEGDGGSIDKLIIYPGFSKPQAACKYSEIVKYWNKTLTHYKDLAEFLIKK